MKEDRPEEPTTNPVRPPSVEGILVAVRARSSAPHSAAALLVASRAEQEAERAALHRGEKPRDVAMLAEAALMRLAPRDSGPAAVINATGVIIHTNLGRAPWAAAAIRAAEGAAATPLFLELDQASGRRGRRYRTAEALLMELTGAEDALVTNNNAAALAQAVGLAGRSGVAVSRGELVEIGGGVRIPDIIRRAGARLVEVGTTNRTRADDFAAALADGRARMVLRVHPSNFSQAGFTETPDASAVARAAHDHDAIVVDDLGSGALIDTAAFGLAHEPLPSERLAAGSDIVTFSGDKLVGGPQAGLIVGRADLIARIRRDPLARAFRPDKVTLAAVAATLELYRRGLAVAEIPVWQMIASTPEALRSRAEAVRLAIADERASLTSVESTIGGGSLPGETLPSWALALTVRGPDSMLKRLRLGRPAIVGRIADGRVLLDLRTVAPADDTALAPAIRSALTGGGAAR